MMGLLASGSGWESLQGGKTGLWWYEICTANWLGNDKNGPKNAELDDGEPGG
jgi:hypothetical protein